MRFVPRIRDTLQIRPAPPRDDGTRYAVVDPSGRERLRLDEAGRFVVLRLDGLTPLDELRARFRERFGRALDLAAFEAVTQRLDAAGLLVSDGRALRALRYLRDQGVRYRSTDRARRRRARTGGPERRASDSARTATFDRAVYLLNEGRLEPALALFEALAADQPTDLRVQTLAGHLRFLLASEADPDLTEDRRDVDWEAFDRALADELSRGRCPSCHAVFAVELGATNHCTICGAAFSSYVLDRLEERRAQRPPPKPASTE